jgi:hypothetical protein
VDSRLELDAAAGSAAAVGPGSLIEELFPELWFSTPPVGRGASAAGRVALIEWARPVAVPEMDAASVAEGPGLIAPAIAEADGFAVLVIETVGIEGIVTGTIGDVTETGGTVPETGGTVPETGGTVPETGGAGRETGGTETETDRAD